MMEGHRIALSPHDGVSTTGQRIERGIVPLLDCIVGDWTPTEAKAVYGALRGWTQEQTAENWRTNDKTGKNPTRQAVAKSLDRAHWSTVEDVLSWVAKEQKRPMGVASA
jgi:hypothetical protein